MSNTFKIVLTTLSFLLIGLTINLIWFYNPSSVELNLDQWLAFGHPSWLTIYVKVISDTVLALGLIVGILVIINLWRKQWLEAIILLTGIGLIGSQFPAKDLFHRPRPSLPIDGTLFTGYGFPSGHTLAATLLIGVLLIVYHCQKRHRISWLVIGLIYIGLIGWSRIYLGAHYASDVAAGYTIGLALVIALDLIFIALKKDQATDTAKQ